jgi:hypothetical protein
MASTSVSISYFELKNIVILPQTLNKITLPQTFLDFAPNIFEVLTLTMTPYTSLEYISAFSLSVLSLAAATCAFIKLNILSPILFLSF